MSLPIPRPSHLLALWIPLGAAWLAPGAAHADPYHPERLEQRVRFFSSGAFEGRATGEVGGDRAGAYLAGEMARLGLEPGFPDGSFLQPFPVILGTSLGPENRLEVGGRERRLREDFVPYAFSDNGTREAEVVFAGYGISAPKLGYDDFAGIDIEGKFLLVLEDEPRQRDKNSPFRAPEAFRFRELRHKAWQARERGATGLLVVGPRTRSRRPLVAKGEGRAGSRAGLLVVNVTGVLAHELVSASGAGLEDLVEEIERTGEPASRALGTSLSLRVDLVERRGTGYNVAGVLPGKQAGGERVVLGAHYDHLGRGGQGSLAPGSTRIHYGADDNASGVAAVLAVAEAMGAGEPPRRDVVFLGFSGEEMGLLGSRHYVEHYPEGAPEVVAMVNLDMVGKLRDDRLLVFGVDTGKGLRELTEELVAASEVKADYSGDGYGPSDHTAFFSGGVPVLHFFTGPHTDYHRPSDRYQKLNYPGLARVARLTEATVRKLADLPEALEHHAPKAPHGRPGATAPRQVARAGSGGGGHGAHGGQGSHGAHGATGGHGAHGAHGAVGGYDAGAAGRSRGYGAYFGSIPDFGKSEGGVLLQGVREGSPADRAGVRAGDTIRGMDGKQVQNLMDFTYVLRSLRPGDEVEVVVSRDGEELRLKATLERRR